MDMGSMSDLEDGVDDCGMLYNTGTLLTTFTCFSKLPVELRIKIWKAVSYLPRDLDLWHYDETHAVRDGGRDFDYKFSIIQYNDENSVWSIRTSIVPAVLLSAGSHVKKL